MKFSVLAIILMAWVGPAAANSIVCTAIMRNVTDQGEVVSARKALPLIESAGEYEIYQTDLNQRAYTARYKPASEEVMLTISNAPDYTVGINATGTFNSAGRAQISSVEKVLVHKLECYKNKLSE